MKTLLSFLSLLFLIFSCSPAMSQTLWTEDFNTEADGAVVGTAAGTIGGNWSVLTSPTGGAASFSKQTTLGGNERFTANGTGNEGVWSSGVINIATQGEVGMEITLVNYYATNTADYIRVYYKLNGGAEVLFGEIVGGDDYEISSTASVILTGSTVEFIVRARENSAGSVWFVPRMLRFDDVQLVRITTLYSRVNGSWTNGTTWSNTLGGPSCACTPNASTHVVVGHTVDVNGAGDAINVTVRNGGTLRWTNNNVLTIARGGDVVVENGGSINRNGFAGASLAFNWGNVSNSISAAGTGTISMGIISIEGAATVDFSGTGSIAISDDLLINAAATVTNNSSAVTIASDLIFNANNASFRNNGTLSVSGINGNNADFSLNNYGTINQTGNFTNLDAGSSFYNRAGGVWNYSGNVHDTDLRLFANYPTNNFNYTRTNVQNIITPVDGYNNITLGGTGAKTALGSFSVSGNWTRSGATFTPGTNTITLNGSSAQTISATGAETFYNLTVNNSGLASQPILLSNPVTVTNTLTMSNGNINLNGNQFTIGTTTAARGTLSHAGDSTNGWMYGGRLRRFVDGATPITMGTAPGFYPLGTPSDYRPFYVGKNNSANSAGTIAVQHYPSNTSSEVTFSDGAVPIVAIFDAYWDVTTSGSTGGTYSLRAGGTGFGTVDQVSDLRLTSTASAVGTHATSGGTPSIPLVNRTALSLALMNTNNFHVASTNIIDSPLPVELVSFSAKLINNQVQLKWKTASELNNDYFIIERASAADLESFQEVTRLQGKGTTNAESNYSVTDKSPMYGRSYYRLKQVDFDGSYSFSDLEMIDNENLETSSASLEVYPNPIRDKKITIELTGLTVDAIEANIQIWSLQGKLIATKSFQVKDRAVKAEITLNDSLQAGLYILKAGPSLTLIKKIVIE